MKNKIPNIPYVNLANQWETEKEELLPVITDVMSKGHYVGGEQVTEFETAAANRFGVSDCVALNCGTDALVCALIGLGIGRGDEVITPPNSFIASTAAIVHIGAVPVFADVLEDQSIDPDLVEAAITEKTKAIMPVHLTGRMAKMEPLKEIAKKYNLAIVEDAAQSIGASYNSELSGTIGDVGCFSAHPLKNLNACGDAGFILTDNTKIAERVRSLRNHGLVSRDIVEEFGYVSRMDTLQAAILSYRIRNLDKVIEKRRQNAAIYQQLLNRDNIYFPAQDPEYFDTFHTFVIQVNRRDELSSYLKSCGVQTAIHYPIPIHLQPASTALGKGPGDFPITEKQCKRILTLPVNQSLSVEQVMHVANSVNAFFEK